MSALVPFGAALGLLAGCALSLLAIEIDLRRIKRKDPK